MHLVEHPIFLSIVSFSIFAFVLSFTSPYSLVRPGCLVILIFNVWLMLRSGDSVHYTHPMYANLLGGSIFTFALQYFNLVVLRRSCYEQGGPTTTPEGAPLDLIAKEKSDDAEKTKDTAWTLATVRRRLVWGVSHILDARLSGTPWEVKNVPHFSEDPQYIPPKGIFLRKNILRCLISVILLDLGRPSVDTAENARLFADDKIPFFARLPSVTGEDIAMRLITTVASVIMTYLLFQAMYSFGAIFTVGLGISSPSRWRPLFGHGREAYSLRHAWSAIWHQGMASCLTGPAKFFTFRVAKLRKGSLLGRYLFAFIAFALSGAMHTCGELTAGIPLSESGTAYFFTTQVLGLLIEDAVTASWRRFGGGRERGANWWQKGVGFVWVLLWLAWSMPVWTYPASRRSQGEGILPFSIVAHFLRG